MRNAPSGSGVTARFPFVLVDGGRALVAAGSLADSTGSSWSQQFEALADGGGEPDDLIAVGALPFDHSSPAHLVTPTETVWFDADESAWQHQLPPGASAGVSNAEARWQVVAEPSRGDFERHVTEALALMDASGTDALRKVVLARTLRVTAPGPIDIPVLLRRLAQDRSVAVFAVPLPATVAGSTRTLVGATPELLVEKTGPVVVSEPLAGSSARFADPVEDRENGRRLLASAKDRREHAAVVEWIADRLTPYCRTLRVPDVPDLTSTRFVWHLRTRIEGELRDQDMSSIALAEVLHPTPAVCGVPVEAARAAMRQLEPFDRGYFSGAVGWSRRSGDGRWMMTLRCADISDRAATLYAGAGVVAGSTPSLEGLETSVKFRALLDALGIDEAGNVLERRLP